MQIGTTKFHGLDCVRLRAPDGATAIVATYGAQVVSWVPAEGDERIFLSSKSAFDKRTPIRGGVPVVFPQFATCGALPHHGLVRTRDWSVAETVAGDAYTSATLHIEDSEETRRLWPHSFRCALTVTVSASHLALQLCIRNPGAARFTFRAALHTYLRVAEIDCVRLEGLHAARYRDRADHDREIVDEAETLAISGEVDRVYIDAPRPLVLRECRRSLTIDSKGFPDCVVWNPGQARCKLLADMPSDAYRQMLCVEAAAVGEVLSLAPGECWTGSQSLEACQ